MSSLNEKTQLTDTDLAISGTNPLLLTGPSSAAAAL